MYFKNILIYIFILILKLNILDCLEPISATIGITAAAAALGSGYYSKVHCKLVECCDNDWIPANFQELKNDLSSSFIGQHIAEEIVVNTLYAHYTNKSPKKALVFSFHGWPGNGKNFLAEKIVKHLYFNGKNSNYVKFYHDHFPLQSKVDEYKIQLKTEIINTVKSCPRSIFVFDEVDKIPETVLDILKPFLDYHTHIDFVDYRYSTFIFLSNTGGKEINLLMGDAFVNGIERENLKINYFEPLILKGAFNEKGGLRKSNNIESMLIDFYIPFLPMESKHLKECIKKEFENQGVYFPHESYIKMVLEDITFGTGKLNSFATSGCKKVTQRVSFLITKHAMKKFSDEDTTKKTKKWILF